MKGKDENHLLFQGINFVTLMAIKKIKTIKPISFKDPVLLFIALREFTIVKMIMNYNFYVAYLEIMLLQFLFYSFNTHINSLFVITGKPENALIFHNYTNFFSRVGKKLLPIFIDMSFFLQGENTTHHQQGNQPHDENFYSHIHLVRFNYNIDSHFVKCRKLIR